MRFISKSLVAAVHLVRALAFLAFSTVLGIAELVFPLDIELPSRLDLTAPAAFLGIGFWLHSFLL